MHCKVYEGLRGGAAEPEMPAHLFAGKTGQIFPHADYCTEYASPHLPLPSSRLSGV